MLTVLIRTTILYIFLISAVRIMGKRQIGQLQPVDLVITLMISEIVIHPIENPDLPLVNSIVGVLLLIAFEIIISVVSLKSIKFRSKLQGNSIVIIRNGVLDQKQIKRLRYNMDDVLESLRAKDVFDIGDVMFAVAETDGTISVLLKPEKRAVTVSDMNLEPEQSSMPLPVVSDGRIIKANFKDSGMNMADIRKILSKKKLGVKEVMLMTADDTGKTNIIINDKEN